MAEEGRLLQFSVDILYGELRRQSSVDDVRDSKDEIEAALEQCFYCLYGHPNKRTKAKHLEDHATNPVSVIVIVCSVRLAVCLSC